MSAILWLVAAVGLAPLILGLVLARSSATRPTGLIAHIVLCALAFNLTFFWQELWLVLPKAWAGLQPTLFHNDHSWSVEAPIAELLQGTGALGTLTSGLAFTAALALTRRAGPTWRAFFFWMAAQGLFQAFSQLAIGTILSGNDVGRALTYLQLGQPAKIALLAVAVVAMAAAGAVLARLAPIGRALAWTIPSAALLSAILIVPFRMPRHIIEVGLIPLIVNLILAGWIVLGAALVKGAAREAGPVGLLWPSAALVAVLAVFQLLLRQGVGF
ncbi:hypothetical protein [Caulobacter sp. NIBR2454]|uniref:hypothetical protein n=1 Tax=Caulobacter sp. NIBR2454 TaxID=3015996 RepID=UPI0022B6405F|nr:hypothetical protein [Caulobacter sp. NIBR2454]